MFYKFILVLRGCVYKEGQNPPRKNSKKAPKKYKNFQNDLLFYKCKKLRNFSVENQRACSWLMDGLK